jgi:plasmid stabilization system protein ParE
VRRARYVLTARAAADLREARAWSRARWGKELTSRYFDDLHEGAQFIAENHFGIRPSSAKPTRPPEIIRPRSALLLRKLTNRAPATTPTRESASACANAASIAAACASSSASLLSY